MAALPRVSISVIFDIKVPSLAIWKQPIVLSSEFGYAFTLLFLLAAKPSNTIFTPTRVEL